MRNLFSFIPLGSLLLVSLIVSFLRAVQIPVCSNQLGYSLCYLRPGKDDAIIPLFESDTFPVVILPYRRSRNSVGVTTDTVLVFEKLHVLFRRLIFQKLLVNAVLTLVYSAASGEHIVYCLLRNCKAGFLFSLRFRNKAHLLLDSRKWLFVGFKPLIHEHHAINMTCN